MEQLSNNIDGVYARLARLCDQVDNGEWSVEGRALTVAQLKKDVNEIEGRVRRLFLKTEDESFSGRLRRIEKIAALNRVVTAKAFLESLA